jgi:hypothetical protein
LVAAGDYHHCKYFLQLPLESYQLLGSQCSSTGQLRLRDANVEGGVELGVASVAVGAVEGAEYLAGLRFVAGLEVLSGDWVEREGGDL